MIHAGDTIHNPVTGERIVFRQTSRETNGEAVVIETFVQPNGFVAAAHEGGRRRGQAHESRRRRFWGRERGIVTQDPALEFLQLGPGVDAELLDEERAGRAAGC